MSGGAGKGASHAPAVGVVNHDVPTDPARLRATRIEQADAAVASAQAKVDRQKAHVASSTGDKQDKQRAHLEAAQEALAQATAARKELG